MAIKLMHEQGYKRELGSGLVLRWANAADIEGLLQLYGYVFRNKESDPPPEGLLSWMRDCMSGRHPLLTANDFALVEDTDRGTVVAATNLMGQPVDFAGVRLMMGRPEVVATHPDYRNRGLIRAIFELIHARSEARGDQLQGITGIRYYYRQFGYEYAVALNGGRVVSFADIPKLNAGEAEPYTLRHATVEDLPTLLALYERERTFARRSAEGQPALTPLATTLVPEAYWRWTLDGMSAGTNEGWRSLLIVNSAGRAVGYLLRQPLRSGDTLALRAMMVEPGVSLAGVLPSVLRGLQALASEIPVSRPDAPAMDKIEFHFYAAHPLYDVLTESLVTRWSRPYAWYIRVPDLPGFMRLIAPVLEQRLAASALDSHTGELLISFYRGGLRLAFEDGRLTAAEDWCNTTWESRAQAAFPPLSFLQLVFGYRSLSAMSSSQPDVWADDNAAYLLDVLFPARASWLLTLD